MVSTTWEEPREEEDLPRSLGGMTELLRPSLVRLSGLSVAVAYGWFLWSLVAGDQNADWRTAAPSLLWAVSATSALAVARHYRLAVAVLIGGLSLAALADILVSGGAVGQWLVLSAMLAGGVLVGPVVTLALGALIAGALLLLLPGPDAWPLLRSVLIGAGLVWAVGGTIFQALRRGERSELRAWRHADEAMRRRGELRGTSKALHEMYGLLERTNRELEIARREAESAREIKARFAANISHELRTPLNLIMGFSRIMHRSPRVYGNVNWTPELRSDVRQIHNASQHLLGMIDDILDLSRIETQRLPLKLEPVDLVQLVEEATSTARGLLRDSSVALVVEAPAKAPELLLDRTRIRQVILNLLSNAIRFTDSGRITLSLRVSEERVHVSVADTGIGIAPEDLPAIFDEFSQVGSDLTTGRGGAGLGLAVCKQFVQLHGGRITVESRVGEGSTFEFSLPLVRAQGGRERLAYYAPEGWLPPLPENSAGDSIIVLSPYDSAARVVARGVTDCRVLALSDVRELAARVESEHPLGVVVLKDPLALGSGPSPEDVWAATGRPDLGVIECEIPLEEAARRYLDVDAYLTKPVQPEELSATVKRVRPEALRLLAVDDDPGFLSLVARILPLALPQATLQVRGDGDSALELVREQDFDLVILDLVMPRMGGVAFLEKAREEGLLAATGIIITTGAPYVEELATALPTRLHFSRKAPPRSDAWLQCLTAILTAAPPDYSNPARQPAPPATARQ